MQTQPKSGPAYFMQGFDLIFTKGLKRFVFIPLMVNLLLFSVAFYYLFQQIDPAINWVLGFIPGFLSWLRDALIYILWPLAVLMILVTFSYLFTTIANFIAAPFNGMLAEKVEKKLSGRTLNDEGLVGLMKDVPRTVGREWTKLVYYIPRAIGFLILWFLLPVVGQIIWFIFTAWMMAIQYLDYPFDNHKVTFREMRNQLSRRKGKSIGFGATVALFSMIPIVNFLVMPVAVCGATAMWVDEIRKDTL
ncbi:Sulfate transporter CysZ [Saliniradius amylolyticus]|uniref:Sulfate transporter CysZ n=1 Tax=Saliniradius amylolyticus TaxID=2183582 RepID=A0A2S2E3J4_9ALTE|nr:sulfate transporter CysZ [Saliniradius amylolyticus]AWL12218.1 Sulfate transporter CysZ [Saliniradius amylolyticus]